MINLALIDKICYHPVIYFCPDKRTVKIKSGNSLVDYMQIKLWFERNANTFIYNLPQESHKNNNIMFIDWLTHLIWIHYEYNESKYYNYLKKYLDIRNLFF